MVNWEPKILQKLINLSSLLNITVPPKPAIREYYLEISSKVTVWSIPFNQLCQLWYPIVNIRNRLIQPTMHALDNKIRLFSDKFVTWRQLIAPPPVRIADITDRVTDHTCQFPIDPKMLAGVQNFPGFIPYLQTNWTRNGSKERTISAPRWNKGKKDFIGQADEHGLKRKFVSPSATKAT